MTEVRYTELSWACISAEEENDNEPEIFFRGADVVLGLRSLADIHDEAAADAIIENDPVREVLHQAFSRWLHSEADAYEVSIMQAMLEHEAGKDG